MESLLAGLMDREQNIMSLQTFEERLITEVAEASDLLRQLASSGTAELMVKHRHELARLSQEELSGAGTTKLAQLAVSLECIAGTSHGARLAVAEVARVMNNCVVFACCRELTKDNVAVLGKQGISLASLQGPPLSNKVREKAQKALSTGSGPGADGSTCIRFCAGVGAFGLSHGRGVGESGA